MLDFLGPFTLVAYMLAGMAIGAFLLPDTLKKYLALAQTICLFVVLFCLGASLGATPDFWGQLGQAGWKAILYALLPMAASVAALAPLARLLMRDAPARPDARSVQNRPPRRLAAALSIAIAPVSVILGVACAQTFLSASTVAALDVCMNPALAALILLAGMDIGGTRGLLGRVRHMGLAVLLIPVAILAGSLVAGGLLSLALGDSFFWGATISCGVGFSSLPSVMAGKLSGANLATLVFFSNLLRELLAFFAVPLVARRVGRFTCIAPCGATSMDTTLPCILRAAGGEAALAAAANGALLTVAVPLLLPLLYSLA